jgi:hypothetical protein
MNEANTTTHPQPPSGGGGWRLVSNSSSRVALQVRLLWVGACVISRWTTTSPTCDCEPQRSTHHDHLTATEGSAVWHTQYSVTDRLPTQHVFRLSNILQYFQQNWLYFVGSGGVYTKVVNPYRSTLYNDPCFISVDSTGGTRRHLRGYVDYTICITCIMYQQLWGYKVEEKLYLGVREQKRLNTTALYKPQIKH